MLFLSSRSLITTVQKIEDGLLSSVTHYEDTNTETVVKLVASQSTFDIKYACLEEQTQEGKKETPVIGLTGMKAYIGYGQHLRMVLEKLNNRHKMMLFMEAVKGVIQSEPVLMRERGFNSVPEYFDYLNKKIAGSCRYYSNLDKVSDPRDKLELDLSNGLLFRRQKRYTLYRDGLDSFFLVASLNDNHHEMGFLIKIHNQLLEISGEIIRIPDNLCRQTIQFLPNLTGTDVLSLAPHDISLLLGREQGCVHMIEVINDSLDTFKMYVESKSD